MRDVFVLVASCMRTTLPPSEILHLSLHTPEAENYIAAVGTNR